ncbi:MAG: hypothetical protein CTY15_13500 [Methylocystis sp.]|nr:MAG: hypothetical protein CTY15_13500 [Methylocystis sp.]
MQPRTRFCGEFSALATFGVAFWTVLFFQAARAEGEMALIEAGADKPRARAASCDRDMRVDGRCPSKPAAPVRVERPLFAIVSIADQSVSVYNHQGLVARSAVSTGMPGHSTPRGIFTILGRERMHASNIYSGAPMPFMQRLTWSGIAMHLGVVPGHPASHGCIRLPADFAAKLWGLTRIGERVVISPDDVTPTEFSHSLLPAPKMQLVADAGAAASATGAPPPAPAAAETPRLNPRQYADRLKSKAAADRVAAAKAAGEAFLAADGKETEGLRLADELKAAEAGVAQAQARADAAIRASLAAEATTAAKPEESALAKTRDEASAAKTKAEEERTAAQAKLDAAKKASTANVAETSEAYRRWQAAAKAFEATETAEKDAELRTTPVSVLISKADKRVYVRQGLTPIFDAPATVRDPKTPLGSHLYIATAAGEDGASLKWSVVSMPTQRVEEPAPRKKGKALDEEPYPSLTSYASPAGPEEALERVEIPQEVRDRIAERLWTGGSIIISDLPLSSETGNVGTDLTIKLR